MTGQTPPEKKPDPVDLRAAFADKANAKFRKRWQAEADLADSFEMSVNWYNRWSNNRDEYKAKNDAQREKSCAEMVEFWDNYLVKVTARLASYKSKLETTTDAVAVEFRAKNLTTLGPVYDALASLDDTTIKSGKAIFDALKPLFEEAPEAPKPAQPNPLDKGNPFKKGPSA